MITILLTMLIALALLGFCAGSEMAYLSSNKLKARHLADEGDQQAQIVMRFHQDPKRFLTMILVGTNLMHVTFAGLGTYLLERHLLIRAEWVIALVLAPVIIIFGETIPKDWFRLKADEFIYRFAPVLDFLDRVLGAGSKVLIQLTDFLIRTTAPDLKRSPFVTREEFRYVIEESAKGGVLLEHEKQLINTILNLGSVRAEEVMVPAGAFPKVPLTAKVRDVKELARQTKTDAVLVYEEIPTLIVGVVYVFDLLFEECEDEPLSAYLKAPLFVNHDATSEKAIFLLQSKHASYAAVIDAKREVVGVISLENLIHNPIQSKGL